MSRKDFMERLEKLLWNISDSEREEALQYYNDYFDDAGEENEAEVIRELVSPEQVAQKIKAGLSDSASEFSEQGYRDTRFEPRDAELSAGQGGSQNAGPGRNGQGQPEARKKETNFWKVLALVLLCILVAPVIVPLGIGLLAVVLCLAVGLLTLAAGIAASGIAVLISGIFVIGVGVAQAFATPAVGIALAGTGCILAALGLLLSAVILWCCVKVVPWIIRGIVGLIRYPFRKAGAKK